MMFKGITGRNWRRILFAAALLLIVYGCGEKPPTGLKKKLIVGTDATLIPMSFITDSGAIGGFDADLMRSIGREAGLEVEMTNVEWAGLFGGLITGKYDMAISSITILEERKKRMAFSIPYLKSGLALVVRKDMVGVESLDDVQSKDLLVGAQTGTTAYFFLEKIPAIRIKGYQAYGHAVTDMINGKIDAVVGESSGTLYYKNQNKDYFQKIRVAGEIMTEEFYGVAMRKDDALLLEKVNGALRVLLDNGTVKALHDKWDLGRAASVPQLDELP